MKEDWLNQMVDKLKDDEWEDISPFASTTTMERSTEDSSDWVDVKMSPKKETVKESKEDSKDSSWKPTQNERIDDFIRGASAGLMKGGANLLETEQKLVDIITLPSRITFEEKPNSTLREKILSQNIKESIAPVTNTLYGDMVKQARSFAEDYLKTKSFAGKVADVTAQAPAFISEVAIAGGGTKGLSLLGVVQGSEEGKIGMRSAKQAGLNAALGKVFGVIEKINPGPQTSIALKTLATASRATLGGITGGATSALSNGDLYSNDPSKFENFLIDFVATGMMAAMPSAKPYDLAKKLSSVIEARTKMFDEFVGTIKDDINADLNHSIGWGKERPVEAMFIEVMKGEKPVKTYKELVKKTESSIQQTQQEKAIAIDKSTAKIDMEPTLGLETLRNNEFLSPGGTANKRIIRYYDSLIAKEKALVKDMTVQEAFKRQSELKMELNDEAMKAQRKPPLTRTEKVANEALISDYNRAIASAVPEFKTLSAQESAKISLKNLLLNRSVVQQTSKKFGFDIQEAARSAQLRGAGVKMSIMGTILQSVKDIILRGNPVERMAKEIMKLQKEIDAISKLQAKEIINKDKIEKEIRRIRVQREPVVSQEERLKLGEQKRLGYQPPYRKQLPAPEKFERVSKEVSDARLREQKIKRFKGSTPIIDLSSGISRAIKHSMRKIK